MDQRIIRAHNFCTNNKPMLYMTRNADAFSACLYLLLLKSTSGLKTQMGQLFARTAVLTLSLERVPDIR